MTLYKKEFQEVETPFEFNLPQQPVYYFNQRRAFRIVPLFTTWNQRQCNKPEFIYSLECTVVSIQFDCKIEKFDIPASEEAFQAFLESKDSRSQYSLRQEIMNKLLYFPEGDLRTKEDFEKDLTEAVTKILISKGNYTGAEKPTYKYYVEIEEKNDGKEYTHRALRQIPQDELDAVIEQGGTVEKWYTENVLNTWYDEEDAEFDGTWWSFEGGGIMVRVNKMELISEQDYLIVSKYL